MKKQTTKKRKFVCDGCGKGRECYLETNQEPHNNGLDDYDLFTEDLKCVLDSTNQTSYNWKEIVEDVSGSLTKDETTKCPKCKSKSLVKYRDGKQCSFCLHIV